MTPFPLREARVSRFHLFLFALLLPLMAADVDAETARQPLQNVEGTLIVVWADPHPDLSTAGGTRYSLALDDGTVRELSLDGQEQAALLNFGKRVTISTLGPKEDGALAVASITASAGKTTPAVTPATKKVLYLLVKYADDTSVPHPPSFYTNLNNPDTPPAGEVFPSTINAFFKKTSWDQFSWIGDVGGKGGLGAPGGWLTLPYAKSDYAPCGWGESCADLRWLTEDAMSLGRAEGIDFSVYDNVNFVISNDLDCCAHGGGFFSATEGKFFGATWEPPWGQEAHIYAHEMGHSLGLPHSGWVYYAYDNPWDVMSRRSLAANVLCGSYPSYNNGGTPRDLFCAEPGNGFIAPHKDYLGWIPPANSVVTSTSASTSVTLEGLALPLGSLAKILTICIDGVPCTGPDAHYFTAEARVRDLGSNSQFDNGIVGEGVIIHEVRRDQPPIGGGCFFNDQSGFAFPVDSSPGDFDSIGCGFGGRPYPDYALFNAQWSPGQTYVNSFRLSVVSRSGSTFLVSTTGMPPPVVNAIEPNHGDRSGGTNVVITGTSFVPGMTVVVDGSPATNVVVVNATTITARMPRHAAATTPVTVTNNLGQSSTLADGFVYDAASAATSTISSSSPTYANGVFTATLGVQARNSGGTSLTSGGDSITLFTSLGTVSSVVDKGNGTYTATLTSSAPGSANISGTINGVGMTSSANVVMKATTSIALASSINPSTSGQDVTFTAMVSSPSTGAISGTVRFYDGAALIGSVAVSAGKASLVTAALTLGSHSITAGFEDNATWGTSTSPAVTQQVLSSMGPPASVVATATSTSSVTISWTGVSGAAGFEIWRSAGAGYVMIGSSASLTFSDGGLTPNTTYLYKLRTLTANGPSAYSAVDPATTVLFTDSNLAGVGVKAVHVTELRAAVNAARTAAGLSAATYTSPAIVAGALVLGSDITELRSALNAARAALGLSAVVYTDPGLSAGSVLRSAHIYDLRGGVQ